MAWVKKSENHWLLYIDGDLAGDCTLVKYKTKPWEYQGQAIYRKGHAISKVVKGKSATAVKNAVVRMAKAQRK